MRLEVFFHIYAISAQCLKNEKQQKFIAPRLNDKRKTISTLAWQKRKFSAYRSSSLFSTKEGKTQQKGKAKRCVIYVKNGESCSCWNRHFQAILKGRKKKHREKAPTLVA